MEIDENVDNQGQIFSLKKQVQGTDLTQMLDSVKAAGVEAYQIPTCQEESEGGHDTHQFSRECHHR